MKHINEYIVNEGLGDAFKSFTNIFKNIMKHGEISTKDLVTIELDAKIFGKIKRALETRTKEDRPTLVPSPIANITGLNSKDMWEIYYVDNGENKYGDPTTVYTYIGHYDCRKTDIGKLEIDKKYQEFVEKYIEQFK